MNYLTTHNVPQTTNYKLRTTNYELLSTAFCPLHLSRTLYKSALFMQNKPKFPDAQMSVNSILTKDYERNDIFAVPENKANSNPIKPNFKIPDRIRSLSSSENAYNPNGPTCKRLDICGVLT